MLFSAFHFTRLRAWFPSGGHPVLLNATRSAASGKATGPYCFLAAGATVLAIIAYLCNEIYSYDIWWQIIIGRDILEKFSVPAIDLYTAAGFGNPYHDSHWLFQVICAITDRFFGMVGIQVFVLLSWATTLLFTFLSTRRYGRLELCLFLVFLAAMASSERFIPRPELITFLLIAFFYWVLQKEGPSIPVKAVLLLIAQVIWVNSHGLFVIGPFMVGCYLLNAVLHVSGERRNTAMYYVFLFAVVCLGTLISPHGPGAWGYALLLFREAGPAAPQVMLTLGELSPTFGDASRSGIAFWFYAALLLCTVISMACVLPRRKVHLGRHCILLGLFAASLTGRRNMALFALVATPMITEMLPSRLRDRPVPASVTVVYTLFLLAWMFFPLSGKYQQFMRFPARIGLGATPSFFPHGFSDFSKKHTISGQVFNSNFLGGFYLYHFFPSSLPLTDGRWEIYQNADLQQIGSATASPFQFRKIVEKYRIKGILLQHVSPEAQAMLPWIARHDDWELVYLDFAVSFWQPRDRLIGHEQILRPGPRTLTDLKKRVEDMVHLSAFYRQTEQLAEYAAVLEELVRRNWRARETLQELGSVYLKTGQYGKAETVFGNLVDQDPESIVGLNELAYLAYRKGRADLAENFLLRALMVDETNKQTLDNLKIIRQSGTR